MTTCEEFVQNLIDTNLLAPDSLHPFIQSIPSSQRPSTGEALAECLVAAELLTRYQADAVLKKQLNRLSIGQYELLDQIGIGGMGAVYKERHRRMKRIVAIKMLIRRPEDWDDKSKRFDREVEVLASLHHSNIVHAYDADECDAGPFLVMEYVPGKDLDWQVRNHGPLDVADAVDCLLQAAHALEYAHSKNVVHRDIKPGNLLRVKETSCIKLADLGVAHLVTQPHASGSPSSFLTEAGQLLGTVAYMAPEQSIAVDAIDHRCDIYSLGCTLFFLLHGRPPYVASSSIDTIMLHRLGSIPPLQQNRTDIGDRLHNVYERMVAKSVDDRFPSMAQVISALQQVPVSKSKVNHATGPQHQPEIDSTQSSKMHRAERSEHSETSILLVEPSPAQAGVIRFFLESLGVKRIQRLMTGTEALLAMNRTKPDVVLSAMQLGDMTGLELAQDVVDHSDNQNIGFVLISNSNDVSQLEPQTAELGAVVLTKPFDKYKLSAALTKINRKRTLSP